MDLRTLCLISLNILLIIILFATKRKKKLKDVILFITTIVLTLSVTELVYRLFIGKQVYYTGDLGKGYFKHDSLLGYTINRSGKLNAVKMDKYDTVFVKTYNIITDSTQPRIDFNHRDGFQHPETGREMVFMGCSITFGVGLDDTACLAYRVGREMQLNTVNLGVQGYGTNQVYQLFLNKYAGVSNTNRVFVYSFIYDHILRSNGVYEWSTNSPFFKIEGDSLVHSGSLLMNVKKHNKKYIHYLSGLGTFRFLHRLLSNIHTRNRVNGLTQTDFDRCFLMIKNMAEIIKRTGGQFVLIDWGRHQWDADYIDDELYTVFEKKLEGLSGLHIIKVASLMDLKDTRYFIPDDGHPSALANERIAGALIRTRFW